MSAARAAKTVDPEVLQAFEGAPLFSSLPTSARTALAQRTRVVTLSAHELLWREGDAARHLGLVLHGRVAIERASARRLMVDVAGAGALVGIVAFSMSPAYHFDVRCLRKARVAIIPSDALRSVVRSHPESGLRLSSALAEEVLRLTRRLEALCAGSVSQRLARVLLGLTERFGVAFPGGVLMPVRLRREDLAALAATTLESASRQISSWKRQGVLVPQPSGFLVKDLRRLTALIDTAEE